MINENFGLCNAQSSCIAYVNDTKCNKLGPCNLWKAKIQYWFLFHYYYFEINFRGTQQRFRSKYIENTFKAIQSTFRSLEMHSKRRYKICICSVILGELESFRNYKGLSIIFPKILDEILRKMKYYERETFSNSSLHHIFESKKYFRFPFFLWKIA